MAEVHVLLVSAQAAPNLLPTLDPQFHAREAVLVVSGKMQKRADDLERVLREAGVRTSRVHVENEHDLACLEDTFLGIAEAKPDQEIALNLTGGTKLMALAAQNVASMARWESFYVDVDTDEVIFLDRKQPPSPLTPTLGLSHYLQAYGFRKEQAPPPAPLDHGADELLQTLIMQVGSLHRPLGQLNWLAQEAEMRNRLTVKMASEQLDSISLGALIRIFEEAGLLTVESDSLRFADAPARSFTKGGWLERHVFRRVAALRDHLGIRDHAANLQLIDAQGVRNELDVVCIARNRLFVIECKTARMDGGRAEKANDSLFKLAEVCRRVGGLGARGMLVSYRPMAEAELRLASALGIEVVFGTAISSFDDRLRAWVRPGG